MKMLASLGLVLASVALATGCAAKEAAPSHASEVAPASPAVGGTRAATDGMTTAKGADRALIVTGEVYVSTRNVAMATERLRTEVERAGGYVSDVQESGSKEHRQAVLELRIPADKTRSLRAALADLGEITSDSEKVEDVTEARADLEARLHNARIEEERIKDILQHHTAGLTDVLAAERELARVREKIEQFDAQQRTMDGKIALATIKVHLVMPSDAVTSELEAWRTPGKSIASAFNVGLKGTAAVLVYTAMVLAASSPLTVPVGIVIAIAFGVIRRRKVLAAKHAAVILGGS